MKNPLDKTVLSVKGLLNLTDVTIPAYQRPYKWTVKNISELFADIDSHLDKSAYRLGSVVFHQAESNEEHRLDIVDGQQRTLTLLLAVWALIETRIAGLERGDLRETLAQLKPIVKGFMKRQRFASQVSEYNLYQNYQELKRRISHREFSEQHIDFLLNRCQVVVFVLTDLSEAFQFFDSQNARGRDLDPHDLLKAFHLREFASHEVELKAASVAHWEGLHSDDLANLFASYLYRVRQWSQGNSARFFGKDEVGLFKGINIDQIAQFPYVESLRMAHHFVDDYNNQYQRKVDGQKMRFPFHLDQMIINGRRFFEMAEHYQHQVSAIISCEYAISHTQQPLVIQGVELGEMATHILKTLNSYRNRYRTGDQYIRTMFDCALIFYIDKFGGQSLSAAIEKSFIWAYRCRIRQQVVQLATMDKYVLENNLFRVIKEARIPSDVLSMPLLTIRASENNNNRRTGNYEQDELVRLFKEMNYYE
ncbi:TPA: DUF262 domain-containing protein [Klebsiella pneumoniae subsp. pneumoniae]|uniref:DUF262 domain-containing protein n=1 Tax=Klebsiella pneumoniae TaxID=573 RepID=UPI002D79A293|nr:DUF262 domain-containing protein [Klebsiella pneumoniae]WRP43724.1 DUF262 domain-containing protein [Klebsiella pneumoniae]HBQ5823556.1 DUF262 domain-containing protein [Klebsiella pneumoniae subsp. pneumoniae]HBQ6019898.1 DUF262 domain-containing protein [Klebsiella pneumoniae subsp. pneumoniae]HDH0211188.1 DUF262 domain-containing protein [Klebsiella pneumoniae]